MKCNNLNIFIDRKKKYNPNGRNQTEEESVAFGEEMIHMLDGFRVDYTRVPGNKEGVKEILELIKATI